MAEESAGKGVVMLSGIREGVPVFWHEAVAVVSGLAGWATQNGPDARIPDLDHVGFSPSGEVFVFPGGKTDPDHVKSLATLLLAILADTSAPAPLLELATPRASGAIREPLDAFVKALAFYQRPNPSHDVQTLAARIEGHIDHLASDRELAALKQKVQHEPRQAQAKKKEHAGASTQHHAPSWLGQALVLVVLAGIAASAYYYRDDLARMLVTLQNAQGGGAPAEPAPVAEQADEPPAPRPRPAPRSPRADLPSEGAVGPATPANPADSVWSRALPPAGQEAASPNPVQPAFATLDFSPPEAVAPGAVTPAPPADKVVYTQTDPGVSPPILMKPRLPSQPPPGVSEAQLGVIELLVDEQGFVEWVRLVSRANRFNDRMLLSAVKAWVFEPAQKDGRPVKYLTRVRVTI